MKQFHLRNNKTPFNLLQIYSEIWEYKSFLLNWTKRELEIRYKGSFLGIIWNFLNPLLSLAIYFFIFSRITNTAIPNYLVFLFIGISFWTFSLQTILRSPDLLISSAGVLRKVYFPQEILIISMIISNIVNYLISFLLVLFVIILTKATLTFNILWFPAIVFLHSIFLYATCLFLSSCGAIMRDLNHIMGTIMSLLFFLTPIIYSADTISKKYAWLLNSQPFACLLSLYRDVAYHGRIPNIHLFLYFTIFSLLWYLFAHWLFNKLRYLISDLI